MVTVFRSGGFRIVIFVDDHEPAHVHVYGDGVAKIAIVGRTGRSEVIYAKGMKDGDVRKALRVVDEHQTVLIQYWSELHG